MLLTELDLAIDVGRHLEAKLLWFVESGGSERQWHDALGVVQTRRDQLDRRYLEEHAAQHGLTELLARLLSPSPA